MLGTNCAICNQPLWCDTRFPTIALCYVLSLLGMLAAVAIGFSQHRIEGNR